LSLSDASITDTRYMYFVFGKRTIFVKQKNHCTVYEAHIYVTEGSYRLGGRSHNLCRISYLKCRIWDLV